MVRDKVNEIVKSGNTTMTALAREIGYSKAAVSGFLSGQAVSDAMEAAMRKWLISNGYYHWVATASATRAMTALEYALKMREIAVVSGSAGMGKTFTCREFQARYSERVRYLYLDPMVTGPWQVTQALCDVLDVPFNAGNAATSKRLIIKAITSKSLFLIFDEAQHLSVTGLDCVRAFHDQTSCGMALVGNENVYKTISGGTRSASFAQLVSRVGQRCQLITPTESDVREFMDFMNVPESCFAMLMKMSREPGALRAIEKVITAAKNLGAVNESTLQDGYFIHTNQRFKG